MAKDDLTFQVGELVGAVKAGTKATNDNTTEIKALTAFMNQTIGATTERDKHYKRVKHTAIGSAIISTVAVLKAFFV